MNMSATVVLPATREDVWVALNDPEVLRQCIPGCQTFERTEAGGFVASARVAVGPVKATFKGQVRLSEVDVPNGCVISGEGEGGIAGFAKGSAKVRLADGVDGGTDLTYDVEAQVGGKIAQLGGRLVNGAAKKYADEFFSKFAGHFAMATV